MPGRVRSQRAARQQDLEPRQLPDHDLDPEVLAGPLGNAFAQQLLRGALDQTAMAQARELGPAALSQLTELAQDPSQREPVESLAALNPTATQLDLIESLELSPLGVDEVSHLNDVADSGADVEELEAVSALHQAGAPLRRIGAQLADAPEPTRSPLPHQAELETALGADLSALDVEVGAAAALAPLGADALAEDGVLRFADPNPDKAEVIHEVVHHLQGEENGQEGRAVSSPDQSGEREAEAATDAVLRGEPVSLDEAKPAERARKSWLGHAGDFASGMWEGAKDTASGLWSMGVGAWNLTTPAVWLLAPERTAQSWSTLTTTVKTIFTDPLSVWDAFKEPFVKDWTEGRPASAIGRGAFELVSLVVGTKGVDKLAKGSRLLSVVDDAARIGNKTDALATIASKTDDLAKVGNDIAGLGDDLAKTGDDVAKTSNRVSNASDDLVKASDDVTKTSDNVAKTSDDVTKTGDDVAKSTDDAAKSADEVAKSTGSVAKRDDTAATTQATRHHVHEGETVTAPHSPYFGKWNQKGIHTWDGLVARCAKDGYEIITVTEDSTTGVRRVVIRRHGVHPNTGEPVSGVFEKTIYPKRLTAAQVDDMGEEAFQAARRGDPDTRYDPPNGELKKNGEPKDGKFEATVRTPDDVPIAIEGWFSVSLDGTPAISSHTPKFRNDWPSLNTSEY